MLFATLGACAPERENLEFRAETACFEVIHDRSSVSGGEARFGEVVVRGTGDAECPGLKDLEWVLFADADGDAEPDEAELLIRGSEVYGEYTTSTRLYAVSKPVETPPGPLRYRIVVRDRAGEEFVYAGAYGE